MTRLSIRTRLIVFAGLAVAATFAVAGVVVFSLVRGSLYDQLDGTLLAKVRALAQLVEYDDADGLETDLASDAPMDAFELWDAAGTSVVRARSLGEQHLVRLPQRGAARVVAIRLPDGTDGRQAQLEFAPRQERDEQAVQAERPLATIAVASSIAPVEAAIFRVRMIVIAVSGVATFVSLALLAVLLTIGLRPVRDVAGAISAIDVMTLNAPLRPADVPVELRPIVERLGELLGRLERAFTRERELTGEVAHELRTPLTGLRSTIEVALGRERTPERYREVLASCLSICADAERTLATVLSLARLDASAVELNPEPIALDALVRDALVAIEERCCTRAIAVEVELASRPIRADRGQLSIVLDNLLDNAASYTNEGGTIRVELTDGGVLRVSNTGWTLPPEQIARVFERFWRADPARTAGHAGIGLALCKKLVELAGGTITADVTGGMFVVTVRLAVA